jgi:hypothetical protein
MKLTRGKYFVTKLNYIFIRKFPSLGNVLAPFADKYFATKNKNNNNRILQFLDDLLNSMYGNNKKENVSFFDVTLWGNINLVESKDDVTGSVISNVGCNQAKFNELKRFATYYGTGTSGLHYCDLNTKNPCCNVSMIFTESIVRDNFETFLWILKYSQLSSIQKDADSSFNSFVNRLCISQKDRL